MSSDLNCVLCGKKLGVLDIYTRHKAGIICGQCLVKHNISLRDDMPEVDLPVNTTDTGKLIVREIGVQMSLPFLAG